MRLIPAAPTRFDGALSDWRAFGSRRYRPFRVLAVAQGFIGALSGPAIVIPLLLSLDAHPALATALAVLPVVGTMAQRLVPGLLDRTEGNLRGIVVLAATVGEPRGLLLAAVIAFAALGVLPPWATIALVGLIVGVFGALGAVGYGLLQSWYQIVLPEEERRLIAPRLNGIALGMGSVLLLPMALTIDALVASIGLWAYAIPTAIAGVAGVTASLILRRIPPPGRVRVPRHASWAARDERRLSRLARVFALASLAAGLSPFLTVYAMVVLGTGAGFAIAISAVSSATLVLSGVLVSSHLGRGSSSRLLRGSFLLRGVALLIGLTAHPANPFAPAIVLLVAVMLAAGDTAGQLSGNERLFRLATGPSVIAFQSHFVVLNVLAYSGGVLAGAAIMLIGGYPSFAILFAAAGATRFGAARATELSPVSHPAAEAGDAPATA